MNENNSDLIKTIKEKESSILHLQQEIFILQKQIEKLNDKKA